MGLQLIQAPDLEPVSLVQAKLVTAEDGSAHDAMFSNVWIPAARRSAEHRTGRSFITQRWRQTFDGFCGHGMPLQRPPLVSIESVKYLDPAGESHTLDPAEYQVVTTEIEGLLLPAIGGGFPTTARQPGAVSVEFTAGYGLADVVPEPIKQWILMAVATWYQQREGIVTGTIVNDLPRDFMAALLDEFIIWKV